MSGNNNGTDPLVAPEEPENKVTTPSNRKSITGNLDTVQEAVEIIRLKIFRNVQDDLKAWAKERYWTATALVFVISLFGIATLGNQVIDKFYKEQKEAISKKFDTIIAKFETRIETRSKSMSSRFESIIDTNMPKLTSKISEVEAKVYIATDQADKATKYLDDFLTDVEEVKKELSELKNKANETDSIYQKLEKNIRDAAINARNLAILQADNNDQRITELNKLVEELHEKFSGITELLKKEVQNELNDYKESLQFDKSKNIEENKLRIEELGNMIKDLSTKHGEIKKLVDDHRDRTKAVMKGNKEKTKEFLENSSVYISFYTDKNPKTLKTVREIMDAVERLGYTTSIYTDGSWKKKNTGPRINIYRSKSFSSMRLDKITAEIKKKIIPEPNIVLEDTGFDKVIRIYVEW